MTKDQAREYINGHPGEHLQQDGSKNGYVCPLCNSGTGPNGTGLAKKDETHFKCFSCGFFGDIIDIIGAEHNVSGYPDQLSKAAEIYGIELNEEPQFYNDKPARKTAKSVAAANAAQKQAEADYTAFYLEAHKNIGNTKYWSERGLSRATADRFKLGYVEEWKSPAAIRNGKNPPASPRLIIPTSKSSYLARDTRHELNEQQAKYAKAKEGKIHIFNIEALETATKPIFITEGELDAMSFYEVGSEAIALGGICNIDAFKREAIERPQKQPYIIALDNDEAGKTASRKLLNTLKEAGLSCCELNAQGKYKDANEALTEDREYFAIKVSEAEELAALSPEMVTQAQYEQRNQAASYIDIMQRELEEERALPEISTSFSNIDKIINGGLYPGLYFIGAISSLGKTTFALQIADAVARQKQDVLIISMEMAKRELIAKSISRLTAEEAFKNGNRKAARCTADILNLKRQAQYNTDQANAVTMAYHHYKQYADHIFISEGIGNITPENIREIVAEHTSIYGKPPILIIDYLQILQADNDRLSDKQKIDKGVVELKRISRDFKIPVIAVSSVNRTSYLEPISMESFKESGGIEFSSDILIGLQYKGMEYQTVTKRRTAEDIPTEGREDDRARAARISKLIKEQQEKAKKGEPQRIEVKILKNRNGNRGTAELNFYPMFNYFIEAEQEEPQPIRKR